MSTRPSTREARRSRCPARRSTRRRYRARPSRRRRDGRRVAVRCSIARCARRARNGSVRPSAIARDRRPINGRTSSSFAHCKKRFSPSMPQPNVLPRCQLRKTSFYRARPRVRSDATVLAPADDAKLIAHRRRRRRSSRRARSARTRAPSDTTGFSGRLRNQRQQASRRDSTHTGLPIAPARWATDVSTDDDEIELSTIAAVSAKSRTSPMKSTSSRRPGLGARRSPFCRL